MADRHWSDIELSRGQIVQRLETAGCTEVEQHTQSSAMWKAPTGHYFSISYENCNAAYLEGIIEQLERWAEEQRR